MEAGRRIVGFSLVLVEERVEVEIEANRLRNDTVRLT